MDEHIPSTSKVPHAPSSHIYQLFTQTDNKDKSSVYKKQEEEERKRKEEEERRQAEEARKKAEEEEKKRLAEEAKRRAEEEQRMAEEARKKAEEEARRQAEEEERIKKEEEERRKAEEAERKAKEERRKQEEAKRKAEEARQKEEEVKQTGFFIDYSTVVEKDGNSTDGYMVKFTDGITEYCMLSKNGFCYYLGEKTNVGMYGKSFYDYGIDSYYLIPSKVVLGQFSNRNIPIVPSQEDIDEIKKGNGVVELEFSKKSEDGKCFFTESECIKVIEEEKRQVPIKRSFSEIKGILNDIKLSPEEKEESFNEEMNEFNELVIELFNENREKYKIKEEDNEEEKRKKYELQQEVATEYLFGCCNEFGDAHGIKCFLNLIDKMQGEENNSENKGKTSESEIDREFMKSMAEKMKSIVVRNIIFHIDSIFINSKQYINDHKKENEEAEKAMLDFYNKYIKDENENDVGNFKDIPLETLDSAVKDIQNTVSNEILENALERIKREKEKREKKERRRQEIKKEWEKNGFFSDENTSDKEKEMRLKTFIGEPKTEYYILNENGFPATLPVKSGCKVKINKFSCGNKCSSLYLVPVLEFQENAGKKNIEGENVIGLEPTNGIVIFDSIKKGLEKKRKEEKEERKKLEEEVRQKRLAEADERRQAEEERKKLEEEERRRAEEKRQKAAEEEERRKQERKEIAKEIKKEWEKNGFFSDENTSDKEKEMRLKTLIGESGTEYYILDKDGRPKTWPVKSGCKVKIDNFYYNNKCSSLYLVPVLEFKENAGKKNIEGENVIELEPTNGIVNFDSIEEGLEIKEEEQLISSILSTETLDRQQLDTEEYNDSDSVNSEESRERKSTYLMSDSDGEIFSIDGRDDKRDDDDIPPVSSSLYQNKPTIPLSTQPVPSVPDNQEDKLSFVPYDGKGLFPKNKNFCITYGGKSYALKIGTSPEKSTLMDQTYIDSDRIQDQKDFSDNDVLFLKGNKIKGKTIFITEIDPNTKKENIYKKPQAIIINGGEVSTDILKRGIQDIKEKEVSTEVMPYSIEYGRQKLEEQIKREKAGRIAREAKRRQEEEKRLKSSSPSSLSAFSDVNKGGEADNSSIASFIKSEQKKNKGR